MTVRRDTDGKIVLEGAVPSRMPSPCASFCRRHRMRCATGHAAATFTPRWSRSSWPRVLLWPGPAETLGSRRGLRRN